MRKYKKKELLETVNLLIEGNDYIAENYLVDQKDITDILIQCQEMAILLGNCLETYGAAGEELVTLLEDYCEKIYQINLNLFDQNICSTIIKKAVERLADIKKRIIDQIPEDKIEMVFFPYKVSMWDSLESVWKAAEEDSECDAYIVPIPYYERDPQGELAVMHYEGKQFPKNVPVVHYMDYNLAERRPDVAFIHNPYDEYNYVTSIHPAYYISELKKYVGKVAYIPYYVSEEPNSEDLEIQERKRGFVVNPGVVNADLIFVQSEEMKKLYVNILEKEIPNVNRKYWEDKIFGLGSPKLDRVYNTRQNDDLLSYEWRSLIYDRNGNRKKVIFYNTSLYDLLNQKNMMDKIEDTLAFFKEREDCVLWWRPHPLYESTLSSMVSGLLPIYKKIVERYKKESWGIYDAGEDLDWAIAETDAYYGDHSSVVQLYKEVGKPILYQDTRVKNYVDEEVDIPIWPCAFCQDGDDIWLVHGKINLLMKYHKSSRTIEVIGSIPEESIFQETLYQAIYKNEDKIYLIPAWAKDIGIYDISKKSFSKIKLRETEKYINKVKFGKSIIFNENLYCIPCFYRAIIKIDLHTQKIAYIDLRHYTKSDTDVYLGDGVLVNGKIVGPWNLSNQLFILDLKSEKIDFISIGEKERRYSKISKLGKDIVLYDELTKSIFRVSLKTKKIENKIDIKYENSRLSTIFEEILVVDASYCEQLVCLDRDGNIRYEYRGQEREKGVLENIYSCGITACNDGTYMYFDTNNYLLYILDELKIKEQYDFSSKKIDSVDIKNLMRESLENIQYENDILKLKEWISFGKCNKDTKENRLNSGEVIKNFIKQDYYL